MRNAKRQYLLKGLIKCGICGLTYHGTAWPGKGQTLEGYYVCGGKTAYRGRLNGKCPSKSIPQQWIEEIVWHECVEFIENPGETVRELAATINERKVQRDSLEAEKEAIRRALAEKDDEKERILDLYRKKIISGPDVDKQFQKIEAERASLEEQLSRIEQLLEAEENLASQFANTEKLLNELRTQLSANPSFEVKREIVRTLVREIVVDTKITENGRKTATVTVRYTFPKVIVRTDRGSWLPQAAPGKENDRCRLCG